MPDENLVNVEMKCAYGLTLIARGPSDHWIVMDADEKSNGHNGGARPMELILMGLTGCTGMDVMSILDKMRIHYTDFKIEATGEKATEHPKVYTRIHLKYRIWGDVPEDKFKEAIELSRTKYCSVGAMLEKATEITYEYEIIR